MKNKWYIIRWGIWFSIMLIIVTHEAQAQQRLSVEKNKPVFFDLRSLYRAGLPGEIVADGSQWLNYSSEVDANEPPLAIAVQVAAGTIPSGMELRVEAEAYRGMSKGQAGIPTGPVKVTEMPRVIINNIKTFATGSGPYEGHRLKIYFVITDYAEIEPGTTSVYLMYTMIQ